MTEKEDNPRKAISNLPYSNLFRISYFVVRISAAAAVVGCSSHKQPSTMPSERFYDRQESALKDPFGYSPNMDGTDISGGNVNQLDGKAIKKDINDVLNP